MERVRDISRGKELLTERESQEGKTNLKKSGREKWIKWRRNVVGSKEEELRE